MQASLSSRLAALGLQVDNGDDALLTSPEAPSAWATNYGANSKKAHTKTSPSDVAGFDGSPPAERREAGDVATWISGVKERTALMAERAFRDVSRRATNDGATPISNVDASTRAPGGAGGGGGRANGDGTNDGQAHSLLQSWLRADLEADQIREAAVSRTRMRLKENWDNRYTGCNPGDVYQSRLRPDTSDADAMARATAKGKAKAVATERHRHGNHSAAFRSAMNAVRAKKAPRRAATSAGGASAAQQRGAPSALLAREGCYSLGELHA